MLCSQPANFRDWHHITTKAKAIAKLQAFERGDDVVDEHQAHSGGNRYICSPSVRKRLPLSI